MKLKCLLPLLLLLMIAGCSTSTSQEEINPLRIGLLPNMDSVTIAAAYELGFFENHGVDVELEVFSSARDRDAAFQTGHLDGAAVDLISVGLLNEGGFPVRATTVTTAHYTLIATPQYEDLASLEGATVLISNHTAIDFVMDQMLVAHGFEWDHIVREEIPNIPTRFEMVRNTQADATLISEPFATMAAAAGLTTITDTFEIDFNPLVLAFSDEVINTRTEELRAFFLAYNEAADYLNSNPMEAHLDLIVDLIGFPNDVINHIELPTFLKSELPSQELIEIAILWLTDRGLISDGYETEMFLPDVDLY